MNFDHNTIHTSYWTGDFLKSIGSTSNSFIFLSKTSSFFLFILLAGGQTLQRWSLLSDSPAWNNIDIRVVAANARSYAYLDGRRWLAETSSQSDSNEVFRLPTSNDEVHNHCPWYNHWLWGLEDGGEVFCPYRDTAVEKGGSEAAIAKRYASRDVVSCRKNVALLLHDLFDEKVVVLVSFARTMLKPISNFANFLFMAQKLNNAIRFIYRESTTQFP